MKSFAVIGLGNFGKNLAVRLCELGGEVLAVDIKPDVVAEIADSVTQAVCGDCREKKVLYTLGLDSFDCVIVALAQNIEGSILITSLLKEIGAKYVVANTSGDLHQRILLKVGADKVVFPDRDMSARVAESLMSHNILDSIALSDDYSLVEVQVPKNWIGETLISLDVRRKYGINVVAVKIGATGLIDVSPDPNKTLLGDDILVVIGAKKDIAKLGVK